MANIHRIGDYNNNDMNQAMVQRQAQMGGIFGQNREGGGPNREDIEGNPIMRAFITNNPGDPRRETFWSMLKSYFCPGYTWKSFIFVIITIDVIMFIISLARSDGLNNDYFLGIQTDTLWKLGAKDSYKMFHGQIYRFVTPMILHVGFLHILQNTIFQLIIGSFFEIIVGPLKFLAIYVVSGLGGILMTWLINDKISVGASTALFGVTGGLLAFIIVNWLALESLKEIRWCLLWFVIIIIVINVIFGLAETSNVDNFGHLGGFVTGLPFSMFLMPVLKTSIRRHQIPGWTYEKYWKMIGGVSAMLWITIGMSMFYFERNPRPAWP